MLGEAGGLGRAERVAGRGVQGGAGGVGREPAVGPDAAAEGPLRAVHEPRLGHGVGGHVDLHRPAAVGARVAAGARGLDVELAAGQGQAGPGDVDGRGGDVGHRPAGELGPGRLVEGVQPAVARGDVEGVAGALEHGRAGHAEDPAAGERDRAEPLPPDDLARGPVEGDGVPVPRADVDQVLLAAGGGDAGGDQRLGGDQAAEPGRPAQPEVADVPGAERGLGRVVAGPLVVEGVGRPVGRPGGRHPAGRGEQEPQPGPDERGSAEIAGVRHAPSFLPPLRPAGQAAELAAGGDCAAFAIVW